ncbi:MAG: hypothetical protein WB524_01765 [Acidobacteriaceae bacterium]
MPVAGRGVGGGANLHTPFHARQVSLISAALAERGMQCLLVNAEAYTHPGLAMAQLLESRVRAAVILSGTPPASMVDECLKSGLRVILINRRRIVDAGASGWSAAAAPPPASPAG